MMVELEGETEEVGRTAVGFMGYRKVPKGNATPEPTDMVKSGSRDF